MSLVCWAFGIITLQIVLILIILFLLRLCWLFEKVFSFFFSFIFSFFSFFFSSLSFFSISDSLSLFCYYFGYITVLGLFYDDGGSKPGQEGIDAYPELFWCSVAVLYTEIEHELFCGYVLLKVFLFFSFSCFFLKNCWNQLFLLISFLFLSKKNINSLF